MNMSYWIRLSLASLPLLALGACRSIPSDAPVEFHEAEEAMKRAKQERVARYLPDTMQRAQVSFAEGTSILQESKSPRLSKEERQAHRSAAIDRAAQAHQLASDALRLSEQVRAWDANIDGYRAAEKTTSQLHEIQERLALVSAKQNATPDAERLKKLRFAGPLAYFDTGKAELDARYRSAVEDLARILREEKSLRVRVSGYADPRGQASFNQKLGRQRADAVADLLAALGVEAERIRVETRGDRTAPAHLRGRTDKLQLERRVEVEVLPASAFIAH